MIGHLTPVRTYFAVFGALLSLTAVTTWVSFQDYGAWNTPIALSIAVFKALLVVLFFMHVKYSSKLIWVAAIAGSYWLLILFAFMMGDYVTRIHVQGWALPIPH